MKMTYKSFSIMLASILVTKLALADNNQALVKTLPAAVKSECTACHIAYPANKMAAKDWGTVLRTLDKHYGTDASVTAQDLVVIQQYFAVTGSTAEKHVSQTQPPRFTTTTWFQREHRVVPREVWANSKVKSNTNCTACHTQAEKGSFAEREIVVPGYEGRKW